MGFVIFAVEVFSSFKKRQGKKIFISHHLQSNYGQETFKTIRASWRHIQFFILFQDGKIFTRSTAALKMFSQLKRMGMGENILDRSKIYS
jgi:predicted DCC family thiol-disulfide oxidoreductase YuxK